MPSQRRRQRSIPSNETWSFQACWIHISLSLFTFFDWCLLPTVTQPRSTRFTCSSSSRVEHLWSDGVSISILPSLTNWQCSISCSFTFYVLINQPMTFPQSVGPAIKAGISGRLPPLSHLGRVTWLLRDLRWQGLLQAGQWSLLTIIRKIQYPSNSGLWWHEPSEGGSFGKAEGARQLPSSTKASGNFLNIFNLKNLKNKCEIGIFTTLHVSLQI